MQEGTMPGLPTPIIQKRIYLTVPYFQNILLTNYKYKYYNVTAYEGFEDCKWNGGRIKTKNLPLTNKIVQEYNTKGIRIASTFSNHIIDTSDEVGNKILSTLYNKDFRNEIILCNEELRLYLRKFNFILKFSITGHTNLTEFYKDRTFQKEKIQEYYLDLFQKYDIVVIHSELAIKRWFINFMKENNVLHKAEVIINIINGCSMCPMHKEHYELIADHNRKDNINNSIMGCILENPKAGFVDGYFKDNVKYFLIRTYQRIKLEGRSHSTYESWSNLYSEEFEILRKLR